MKATPEELPNEVELFGSEQPTIFTPPLRKLTPRTTRGFECIRFAEEVLEVHLYPWQKWLLIHALELLENGKFRFRTVVVLVARQNGKSTLLQVLSLWRMYVDGAPLVIGTAQNLDVAEECWSGAVELAEANEELAAEIKHIDRTNGKKALRLESDPKYKVPVRRYKVAAANRRGGRGLSGDLVLLDELREHSNWDAWAAVTKTTMAKRKPQVWAASNAGDASSVVLSHLRKQALDAIEEDRTETQTLGLFEWSAVYYRKSKVKGQPGTWENLSTGDRKGWAMANPSLNWGDLALEALESAWNTDPDPVFRTECLCQWVTMAKGGAFEDGVWEALQDPGSKRAKGTRYYFCVDVSWDRSSASVAVAGLREDGKVHIEIVMTRPGTDWVIPWIKERADRENLAGVVVQAKGAPVSSLLDGLRKVCNVVEWQGSDIGPGTGTFYDAVRQGRLRHRGQPVLDVAVSMAVTRPLADSWVWDRKRSLVDIAPLVAATGAVWALLRPEEPEESSAYDDEELMFV